MSETLQKAVETLLTNQAQLTEAVSKLAAPGSPESRSHGPHIREGESIMTSRGFQMSRIVGAMNKKLDKSFCKVELELCDRIKKDYEERGFYRREEQGSVLVPFSSDLMLQTAPDAHGLVKEVADTMAAGVAGYDPDEADRVITRAYGHRSPLGTINKTLSWTTAGSGAELVGPPVFGEPIELLRNQAVFMKAGAKVIPFPPSGRIVWPRFTGATTAYWLNTGANNRSITTSEITTGDLVLTVKKLGIRVTVPNELFRFPTVSVEQVLRMDMTREAGLKMDRAFLEGVGSAAEPKGLLNYDNIVTHTAGTVGTDGNTLEPEDIMTMIGKVEEKNLTFNTWVGRPLLYAQLANKRADAVSAGDKKGPWMFNILRDGVASTRDVTNNSTGKLEGYDFHKSNQVSNTRSKGSASNLTYLLGGDFSQYMIAMSGVMEFFVSQQGENYFSEDQTAIRLITWVDGAPRYEEAFVLCDTLVV